MDLELIRIFVQLQDLAENQPTPNDIDYSLERYNLIRRTYWVNGQREKAVNLPCPVIKPFGYIVLFTENGGIVGTFVVDGKVSSLNSFLTPDSEYYSSGSTHNDWLPDVDVVTEKMTIWGYSFSQTMENIQNGQEHIYTVIYL